jgi:hypothetical protein
MKTPSSSKNIPNGNTYMNVFFISYIYKPATSSHAKPGLFETTSLTLLLTGSWISPFGKSSCAMTPELDFQQIPEFHRLPKFVALQVHGFRSLRVRNSEASQVQDSRSSLVRDFAASQFQDSRSLRVRDSETSQVQDSRSLRIRDSETSQVQDSKLSRIREFAASQVQDSRSSHVLCSWKLISRTLLTSTFRGWQVFLNSPTLAPRGSGLTPTIRFHKNLRISVKNVTLGTSEGTRSGNLATVESRRVRGTAPPPLPL